MSQRNSVKISIIAAVAANGVIGAKGGMPWSLSTDLKRFRALTLHKPVIMGRKTFQSLNKPLPNRHNIVISRHSGGQEGLEWVDSLEAGISNGIQWCDRHACDEIFIIGGGQIYRDALALRGGYDVGRLYITHVLSEPDGDTNFPKIIESDWKAVLRTPVPAGEKDSDATLYVEYERVAPDEGVVHQGL